MAESARDSSHINRNSGQSITKPPSIKSLNNDTLSDCKVEIKNTRKNSLNRCNEQIRYQFSRENSQSNKPTNSSLSKRCLRKRYFILVLFVFGSFCMALVSLVLVATYAGRSEAPQQLNYPPVVFYLDLSKKGHNVTKSGPYHIPFIDIGNKFLSYDAEEKRFTAKKNGVFRLALSIPLNLTLDASSTTTISSSVCFQYVRHHRDICSRVTFSTNTVLNVFLPDVVHLESNESFYVNLNNSEHLYSVFFLSRLVVQYYYP